MKSYTIVVIPTLYESDLLKPLLDELVRQGAYDELIVMDNRKDASTGSWSNVNGTKYFNASHLSLYGCWNWAWAYAKVEGTARGIPSQVVLLNDDIVIPENFVQRLVEALRSRDDCWCAYPDYNLGLSSDRWYEGHTPPSGPPLTPTRGTYKDGGMWGCAFALRGEILNDPVPPIDLRFQIWSGDDDLVTQIDLHGGLTCRVNGLALEHHASTTVNQHPELAEICWADVERFNEKYASSSQLT